MVSGSCFGKTEPNLREISRLTFLMDMAAKFSPTENITKGTLRRAKLMVMAHSKTLMEESMKENGKMTNSMDLEERSGIMEQRLMRENS
jgi:hypothetical protein